MFEKKQLFFVLILFSLFSLVFAAENVSFVSPTPLNGTTSTNVSWQFAVNATGFGSLSSFVWNWNGTNYRFYDSNLTLLLNLNNNSAMGEVPLSRFVILQWHLNETSGTVASDSSGNGINGTVVNSPSWVAGKINNSLSFNRSANQKVTTPAGTGNFTLSQPFSLECWIKSSDTVSGMDIWSKTTATGSGYIFYQPGGIVRFYIANSVPTVMTMSTTASYSDGNWHHVVATYDGSSNRSGMKIYVDGTLPAQTGASSTSLTGDITTTQILTLGARSSSTTANYNGSLDECVVYNKSLSLQEVQSRYYNGTGTESIDILNVVDLSLNNLSGTSYDGYSWDSSGRHGVAFAFDGVSSFINFGLNRILPKLGSASGVTFSAWVKPTSFANGTTNDTNQLIYIPFNSSNSAVSVDLRYGGKISCLGRSQNSDSLQGDNTSTSLPLNSWSHVACVYDYAGGKIYTYVNGVSVLNYSATFGSSTLVNGTASTLYRELVGSRDSASAPTTYFNGSMAEVYLKKRALSSDEISELYGAYLTEVSAGNWVFQENKTLTNGTYLYNATGNNGTTDFSTETRTLIISANVSTNTSVSIVSPLNTTYASGTNILVNISSTNANATWWNVDSGSNNTYTTETYQNFTQGDHILYAYANSSNGSIVSANVSFHVNASPIVVTIISPINTIYTVSSVLVNISAPNASAIWFNNGTANITYTTPAYYNWSDGTHTLTAYANNSENVISSTNVTFTVNTTSFVVWISPVNGTIYSTETILVSIVAGGNVSSIWWSDGTTNYTYTVPTNYTFLEGSYNLTAYKNDSLGNINSSIVSFSVVIPQEHVTYIGDLDEIVIYNREISAAEVLQRYNGGAGVEMYSIVPGLNSTVTSVSGNVTKQITYQNVPQTLYFPYQQLVGVPMMLIALWLMWMYIIRIINNPSIK